MKVTVYKLANSFDENSRRIPVSKYEAPLPDFFDAAKDGPEEIEVHISQGTQEWKYDVVEDPSPGHTRFRILVPDGFQIVTVATTADSVSIEVESHSDSRPQHWT